MKYLIKCFNELKKNNLSLRLDKCEFAQLEVEQFGLVISATGIKPSPQNVAKIDEYPRPNNIKELKCFLGMANYYRANSLHISQK